LITDRRLYATDERMARERLLDAIGAAARAGVDLVQIRERDLDDRTLMSLATDAIARTAGTGARVIVNDRVDVALASRAAGVHLRSDSVPAPRVRAITAELTIGCSVHGSDEAAAIERNGGCDYLIAGTIFPTPSKADGHELLGVDGLRRVCATVCLPVLAIGGITVERAPDVAQAGAAGIAGIRIFGDPSTVADTVTRVRQSFDT
jgi:thiamine-phosphate pyrophosphorylase